MAQIKDSVWAEAPLYAITPRDFSDVISQNFRSIL